MSTTLCQCFVPSTTVAWTDQAEIGVTDRYWELSRMRCSKCGTPWLSAFLEFEAFSRSGRHYRAPTNDAALEAITPEIALHIIRDATFRIAGGSRFDGVERVVNGPGKLFETP